MHLRIGQVAGRVKVNPKTIRYYEEVGLMPRAKRSESGYRLYSEEEVARLRLIRRAKLLGLSLQESKQIVEYAATGRCLVLDRHLLELLEIKVAKLEDQVAELQLLRKELQDLCDSLRERAAAHREGEPCLPCGCLQNPDDKKSEDNSASYSWARDGGS